MDSMVIKDYQQLVNETDTRLNSIVKKGCILITTFKCNDKKEQWKDHVNLLHYIRESGWYYFNIEATGSSSTGSKTINLVVIVKQNRFIKGIIDEKQFKDFAHTLSLKLQLELVLYAKEDDQYIIDKTGLSKQIPRSDSMSKLTSTYLDLLLNGSNKTYNFQIDELIIQKAFNPPATGLFYTHKTGEKRISNYKDYDFLNHRFIGE